jgi:hypothetical protein
MGEASLAEQQPAPEPRPISRIRIKQTSSGAWQVRYRQDDRRNAKRGFATEDHARAWIDKRVRKYGGAADAAPATDHTELTVQGDDES